MILKLELKVLSFLIVVLEAKLGFSGKLPRTFQQNHFSSPCHLFFFFSFQRINKCKMPEIGLDNSQGNILSF